MREPNPRQLPAHISDIFAGSFARMLTGGYRVLFRRQTKGVIAHGVEDVLALHPLEASRNIGRDITEWVSYVQTFARWIREHIHYEERLFLRKRTS